VGKIERATGLIFLRIHRKTSHQTTVYAHSGYMRARAYFSIIAQNVEVRNLMTGIGNAPIEVLMGALSHRVLSQHRDRDAFGQMLILCIFIIGVEGCTPSVEHFRGVHVDPF